ncbi:hypothetical protein Bca4012_065574 [Brassica carinata]
MGRLVRVRSGHWEKSDEGSPCTVLCAKNFVLPHTTPMVLTYKLPPCMIDPEGSQSQPTNVETYFDVEVMMSIDEWTNDVHLCLTYGALEVAKYQFLCRSLFTISSRTYLSEDITEEQHLASINAVIRHDKIYCSEEVLKDVFSEDKMVLLYRFYFEVEKAKSSIDLNARPLHSNRNINLLPDYGGMDINIGGHPRGRSRANSIPDADDEMSDNQNYFNTNWSEMEIGQRYWESMIDHGTVQPCAEAFNLDSVQVGGGVGRGQTLDSREVTVGQQVGHNLVRLSYEVIPDDTSSEAMGQNGV